MSLKVLFSGGYRDSVTKLRETDFVRQNFGATTMTSTRVTSATPDGVLAGMIAVITAAEEAGVPTNAVEASGLATVGVFERSSSDGPFENQPAIASGKVTILVGGGKIETDLYETENEADSGALTYAFGDSVFVSQNGMVTNDPAADAANGPLVGFVFKVPTADDPFLGINTVI